MEPPLATLDAGADGGQSQGAEDAGTDAAPVSAPRALQFRVRTSPLGGRYAPRNIGAIWIEDGEGAFIETLELWAAPRKRYLRRFLATSLGDVTDAVTSATLLDHELHEVRWDLTDGTARRVPDGPYVVLVEMTDRDASGDVLSIPFTLGPEAMTLVPEDAAHFLDMRLTLE